MPRQGLNGSLVYQTMDGNEAVSRGFRVRVKTLQEGFTMVAEESTGRTVRAFYPHQVAPTAFALEVMLNGVAERDTLNRWLLRYQNYILSPARSGATPQMTATVASRNFRKSGVLISGVSYDRVLGQVLFQPVLVFDTTSEVGDETGKPSMIEARDAVVRSPHVKYFYPTGTQLAADDLPDDDAYNKPIDPGEEDSGYGPVFDGSESVYDKNENDPRLRGPL